MSYTAPGPTTVVIPPGPTVTPTATATPTPTATGTSNNSSTPDCAGLTTKECTNGQNERNQELQQGQSGVALWKAALGGASIALDLADLFQTIAEVRKVGGASVEKILEIVGDAVGILGDAAVVLSQLAIAFHWDGLKKVADTVGIVANAASAAYKFIKSVVNNWFFQVAINVAFYTFTALFAEEGISMSVISAIVSEVSVNLGNKVDVAFLARGLLSVAQAGLSNAQLHVDTLSGEPTYVYCAGRQDHCN